MSTHRHSGFQNVDWQTLSLYLCLMAVGWMMVVASTNEGGAFLNFSSRAVSQGVFIGLSFILILAISFIDWKFWRTISYAAYAIAILLLILVLFFGSTVKGATSWFRIAGFGFQPAEIAKFGTCLALASYLSAYNTTLREFKYQIVAFALFLVPMWLILLQPDAGSAMVFTSFLILFYREGLSANFYIILFTMAALFIIGLKFPPYFVILGFVMLGILIFILNLNHRRLWLYGFMGLVAATILGLQYLSPWYIYIFLANFLVIPVLCFILWTNGKRKIVSLLLPLLIFGGLFTYGANFAFNEILKPHQRDRINVWLNPSEVGKDVIYNLRQSKLAIGSGGTWGKGFLEGTMTKFNYVPEQSTDFIFCTIGEEQGFAGVMGIIIIYVLFLFRLTVIAERQRSDFSRNYIYGVVGIFFLHFFINIGMTMGLVPIIGIPLPFLSYGGSSLLGFSLMVGVLLKLDSNRFSI